MQLQTEKETLASNAPFRAFINLISLDQEIRKYHEQIIRLTTESDTLSAQKITLEHRFVEFKQHIHDVQKMVKEQEHILQELDEQERAKREQLQQLTDPKQYLPLNREIDRLKAAQHEQEQHLMTAWNKGEIAHKELQENQLHHTAKIQEITALIEQKNQEISHLKSTVEEKKKIVPSFEQGIPQEWLEKYIHMRLEVPDPVVTVMQGGCSACSYPVTHQEQTRLARRAVLQCKGCFRLLYMAEAMKHLLSEGSETL
jgi:predicted  nucleic acid-binding Zn-ribbon protein